MDETLKIGDKIRPWGGINYGTLGFFCSDGAELFLATCDHVLKTLSTPDKGPQKLYFPFGSEYAGKVAIYEGRSLVSKKVKTADFALARVLLPVESATALPQAVPATKVNHVQQLVPPSVGDEVLLWGARTAVYHSGVILSTQSEHSWPHSKYGLVKYEKQFSVAVTSDYTPAVGDSGGFVITPEGGLVGIMAALSGVISDAGNRVIHCVPVEECCGLMGVTGSGKRET